MIGELTRRLGVEGEVECVGPMGLMRRMVVRGPRVTENFFFHEEDSRPVKLG